MRSDPWGDVSSWALKGISTQKLGVKRTYHEAAFGNEDEGVVGILLYILSAWNSGRKVLQGVEITDASSTRAFVDGSLVRMVARREQNFLTAMLRGVDTCRLVVDSHQSQMVVLPERDAKPKGPKSKLTEWDSVGGQ